MVRDVMQRVRRLIACLFLLVPNVATAVILEEPPAAADPDKSYVIYLHGAILTGTNGHAVSPVFGAYEYRQILERFEENGYVVMSAVRKDDADFAANVRTVVGWIERLKGSGVPSSNIAVVGASMGGIIAGRVSHSLRDREITYVLLAALYDMKSYPPVALSGQVLSIRDEADDRSWVEGKYFENSTDLAASRVVTTKTGRGHGLLYTPHDAWFSPALEWITRSR